MVKRVSLVAKKQSLSVEQFKTHWSGPHIEIVRQLPGLRGIRLNYVADADGPRVWDGIGELWFDSVDAARAAFQVEPVRSRLVTDRARFIGQLQVYYVTEDLVVAPPTAEPSGEGFIPRISR